MKALEVIGAVGSIVATVILAVDPSYVVLTFVLYLIANFAWMLVGIERKMMPLVVQNFIFLLISIYGIVNNV